MILNIFTERFGHYYNDFIEYKIEEECTDCVSNFIRVSIPEWGNIDELDIIDDYISGIFDWDTGKEIFTIEPEYNSDLYIIRFFDEIEYLL